MDKETLRKNLLAEKNKLQAELEGIATYNEKSGDWVATPTDVEEETADKNIHSDTTEEWNERRALMVQLETRYNLILRALEKDDTALGICEVCGEEIKDERLEANPAATTCSEHMDKS